MGAAAAAKREREFSSSDQGRQAHKENIWERDLGCSDSNI